MSRWRDLAKLLSEARALGAEFKVTGDKVSRTGPDLPADVVARLDAFSDIIGEYLNIHADDREAEIFFAKLGVKLRLIETVEDCPSALAALDADIARYGGPVAVDLETSARCVEPDQKPGVRLNKDGSLSSRQPKVKDDGAALSPHRGKLCLLQCYAGGDTVHLFRGPAMRAMVRSRWLRSHALVSHNAKFDGMWLRLTAEKYNTPPLPKGLEPGRMDCSLQAAGLILGCGHAGENRKLETVAAKLLQLAPPKRLATSDWDLPELTIGQQCYAAADAVLVWRIWQHLHPAIDRPVHGSTWDLSRRHAYDLQVGCGPAIGDMEWRGVGIDRTAFDAQVAGWTAEYCAARDAYESETGKPPPLTTEAIRAWLGDLLTADQLRTWKRTPGSNALSTAKEALFILNSQPEARGVMRLIQLNTLLRSFGPKLLDRLDPMTGRFHSSFNIAAAKTGRFTCREPNLQQLPAKRAPAFRKCITARDGYLLVGGDFSQVEVRAGAWISGDVDMTELFRNGEDIHRSVAASIAGVPLAEVTSVQRAAAKAIVFGSLFGIEPAALAAYAHESYGVEMSIVAAREALDRFFARFRGFRRWRDDHARECQQRGFIQIPTSGRLIDIKWDTRKQPKLEYTLCSNAPVQGSCADLLMLALRRTYEMLRFYGICGEAGGLIACVHDEIILEVRENRAEIARHLLQHVMVAAFEATFPKAPTTGLVTAQIGKTWFGIK